MPLTGHFLGQVLRSVRERVVLVSDDPSAVVLTQAERESHPVLGVVGEFLLRHRQR